MMKRYPAVILIFSVLTFISCTHEKHVDIIATTDLHGMLLPFNFAEGKKSVYSLANLPSVTKNYDRNKLILLDNGDILQGDPLVYYFNFVDTTSEHIVPEILNYLHYDAATTGNHDIETGHKVYDRVRRECKFPLLAANAVDKQTGEPYFKPYTIIRKNGLKIAVFGLITPSVPNWLPETLYHGITFEGMVETARRWMPVLKSEKPDVIVGLFHSGVGFMDETTVEENSSWSVAHNVPGFDIILSGHDHKPENKSITDIDGNTVLILDGGSRAETFMHAVIDIKKKNGIVTDKKIEGELIDVKGIAPSEFFTKRYAHVAEKVEKYTSEVIGTSAATASTRDAFSGPSSFVDLIHTIQLDVTGAQVSLAAPLSFDESVDSGNISIKDMFRLYRFENFLYTLKMTGQELDSHLEHSSALWFNTMKDKQSHLLNFRTDDNDELLIVNGTARLRYPSYNFDSAMGIVYSVDVSKPEGERVNITSLADGTPFSADSTYTVAVNSYRANGGGGHFRYAGIDRKKLPERTLSATDRDLRYYMTIWIKNKGLINPQPMSQWSVTPEKWVNDAWKKDSTLLFNTL